MTLRKPLLWIGSLIGVLVLVVAALAIFVATRSDEWWRDQLATTLSNTLGREVEMQGPFRLNFGRRVTAEAATVRIANPEWAETKDMLQLGSLLLEFDLLSVLGDTLLIHRLELADIQLVLEENQDGETNWEFPIETEPPPAPKAEEGITLPVQIEQFSLQRAQLSLSQPRWERTMVLEVETMTGGLNPDDETVLDGSGRLGDLPFSLKGNFGKIADALSTGPVSYELSGNLGKTSLRSKGSIDSLVPPLRPQLDLTLSGPDIARVTTAMGAPKIAEGPFEARVDVEPGGRGISGRIRGQFGTLQLHADISAESLASIEHMDVTTRLSGENLAAVADLVGMPPLPKGAFAIDAVLQRDNSITRIEKMTASVGKHRVSVGGVVGAWPELKDTKLELELEGPDLAAFTPTITAVGLGRLPPGAYTAKTVIESSETGLHVRPSKVTAGGYQATAEGHVTTKDQVRAELNVTGAGPDLSMISRLVDIISLPPWPFQAKGKIVITGEDITLIGTAGTAGEHSVAADGPIAFSEDGPVQLDVKGSGPSLQAVLQGLGYDVIPAAAAYQVEGHVEFVDNRVVVTAKQARLGPAGASATLRIPNVNKPTALTIDVGNAKTTDLSMALALVGVELDLPRLIQANLSGQMKHTENTIALSNVRGTIRPTLGKVVRPVDDTPKQGITRIDLDITASDLERLVTHPAEQTIPFQIEGSVVEDKNYTRVENVRLKLGDIEARAHGRVGSWATIAGTELSVSAQGPNVDAIAAIVGRPLPEGAFSFDGHVGGTENAYRIDRMTAQVGRSNLSGDLTLTSGKPPLLTGQVSSSYLDFALLRSKAGAGKTSETNSNVTPITKDTPNTGASQAVAGAAPQQKQQLVFPDTPIELEVFDKLDMEIEIRIDELSNFSERGGLQGLRGKLVLKGGDLTVTDFAGGEASGANISGNLTIRHDVDLTRIDVEITGNQIRLGLAAAPGQDPATYPPIDIEARLTGSGNTYRKLVASLNGRIKAVQGEGRVNNNSVNLLLSDVLYELFQALNPVARSEPTTRLNCSVYIVNLTDGLADIQSIVVQTDRLNIVSSGTVDLNTERINVDFSTRPRRGLGISASMITNPFVKLGGTLSRPAIALDAGSATVATGAAVATGGLSILAKGFWDRFLTTRDPCGQALRRDAERQAEKAKQPLTEPVGDKKTELEAE